MSMEATSNQAVVEGLNNRKEQDVFSFADNVCSTHLYVSNRHAHAQIPDTSPTSNGSYVIKPMDEAEITRQLKGQHSEVDIYNTGTRLYLFFVHPIDITRCK